MDNESISESIFKDLFYHRDELVALEAIRKFALAMCCLKENKKQDFDSGKYAILSDIVSNMIHDLKTR